VHRLLRPLGITTPQEHWLHHARDLQGNFGNFTTLWDRLFGTYLDPLDPANGGRRAGLAYDQDFLGVLTLGRWKLPSGSGTTAGSAAIATSNLQSHRRPARAALAARDTGGRYCYP